jgi:hypothetical protein
MKNIQIRKISNGWIVSEIVGSVNNPYKYLAVFNRMEDLVKWMAENFKLPETKEMDDQT